MEFPRLRTLQHYRSTVNPTYDFVMVGFWANLEAFVGVICACLPRISVLCSRIHRHLFPGAEAPEGAVGAVFTLPPKVDSVIATQSTGNMSGDEGNCEKGVGSAIV